MRTPGPWSVVSYLDEHDRRGRNVVVSHDTPGARHRIHSANHCVAYAVPNYDDARAICDADARIAELEAALRKIDEWGGRCAGNPCPAVAIARRALGGKGSE